MKKSKFSEEQIAYVLRQVDAGVPIADVCQQVGVSEATFYIWKKKYAHLGVAELRQMRQLECTASSSAARTRAMQNRRYFVLAVLFAAIVASALLVVALRPLMPALANILMSLVGLSAMASLSAFHRLLESA